MIARNNKLSYYQGEGQEFKHTSVISSSDTIKVHM